MPNKLLGLMLGELSIFLATGPSVIPVPSLKNIRANLIRIIYRTHFTRELVRTIWEGESLYDSVRIPSKDKSLSRHVKELGPFVSWLLSNTQNFSSHQINSS